MLDYDLFLNTQFVGDPGRIRQVLTNLAGDAVKFTASCHVLIRVIGVPGENGLPRSMWRSKYTGIGIAPEKINRIFGEFNRVQDERNRNFEGIGLGLAITRKLVDWVGSELGKGSCFGFKIEMPNADQADRSTPKKPRRISHASIVDNLEINRMILAKQMDVLQRVPSTPWTRPGGFRRTSRLPRPTRSVTSVNAV